MNSSSTLESVCQVAFTSGITFHGRSDLSCLPQLPHTAPGTPHHHVPCTLPRTVCWGYCPARHGIMLDWVLSYSYHVICIRFFPFLCCFLLRYKGQYALTLHNTITIYSTLSQVLACGTVCVCLRPRRAAAVARAPLPSVRCSPACPPPHHDARHTGFPPAWGAVTCFPHTMPSRCAEQPWEEIHVMPEHHGCGCVVLSHAADKPSMGWNADRTVREANTQSGQAPHPRRMRSMRSRTVSWAEWTTARQSRRRRPARQRRRRLRGPRQPPRRPPCWDLACGR